LRDVCGVESEALARRAPGSFRYVRVDVEPGGSLWFYIGERSDYVLVPLTYCSCPMFASKMRAGEIYACSHLRGLAGAMESGRYRVLRMKLEEAVRASLEALHASYAYTVRVKLAVAGGR
jgi:predicted nucleic acid-binding Zn finger protein